MSSIFKRKNKKSRDSMGANSGAASGPPPPQPPISAGSNVQQQQQQPQPTSSFVGPQHLQNVAQQQFQNAQQGFQNSQPVQAAQGLVQKGMNSFGIPNQAPAPAHAPAYGSNPTTPSLDGFSTPQNHGRSPFPQLTPQDGRSPASYTQPKFNGPAGSMLAPGSPGLASGAMPSPGGTPNHPWSKVPITNASPFPRYGHASNYVAARDGEIFVMGGLKGADVFGDLWVIETDSMAGFLLETEGCPSPRVGHAALTLGNAFIVFGGDTKVTDTDTPDNNLYLLNTSTLKWTVANPQGPRPAGRYGHSLSTIGSKLFVFGGQLDDYFFDDLVCFDLTKLRSPECQWTTIEPADGNSPPPRTNHTVVTYQDKLYMYGGTDGQLWYSDTWCYDPVTNLWTQLSCSGFIPTPSEGHAATVVDDVMYVFGGRSSKGDDLGILSALKLSSKRWFTFENMGPAPAPRSGHSMTACANHKVLVMGGESQDQDDTNVYVLDTNRIRYPAKSSDAAADTSVHSVSSVGSQNSAQNPVQNPVQSPPPSGVHPPVPGAIPLPGMVPSGDQDSYDREIHSNDFKPVVSNLGSNSEEFESADDGRPISVNTDEDAGVSPVSAKMPAAWPSSSDTPTDQSEYSQSVPPSQDDVSSRVSSGVSNATASGVAGVAGIAGIAGVTAGVAGMAIHQKSQDVKIEPSTLSSTPPPVPTSDPDEDVKDVIEQLKATNSWYESELAVAQQSGFTPSKNPVADIEKVRRRSLRYSRDQGSALSERDILVQALVDVKQELQNVKTDVARQSEEASQKLKALNDENQQLRAHLEEGEPLSRDIAVGGAGAAAGAAAGAVAGASLTSGDSDLAVKYAELQKKYNLLVTAKPAEISKEVDADQEDASVGSPASLTQQLKQEKSRNAELEYELETLKEELATTQTKWKDVGGAANEHVTALQAAGAALAASQLQHSVLQKDLDTHKTARVAADEEVVQLKRQLEDMERNLAMTTEELEKERELGAHAREQNEQSTTAMTNGIDKILAMWGGSALIGGAAGFAGSALAKRGSSGDDDETTESRDLNGESESGIESSGLAQHPQFVALQKQVDGAQKLHIMHKEAAEQASADLLLAQKQVEELRETLLKSEQENHILLEQLEELKGNVTEHRRQLEDHEQALSQSQTQSLRLKELEAELATTLESHRTELENLETTHRSKLAEMEKAKKDSLSYMQNSDLALRKTREELSRSKDQVSQLQDELSELQIRAKSAGTNMNYDDDDDDDEEKFGSHELELQLRDARATLVVIEQERDELRLANADLRKKAITHVQDVEKYKRRYQRLKARSGEDSFNDSEFDQTHNSGFESPR